MLPILGASVHSQEPIFHSKVNLFNVTFGVRSPQGAAATDLKLGDVEALEDDIPQTIRFFDNYGVLVKSYLALRQPH